MEIDLVTSNLGKVKEFRIILRDSVKINHIEKDVGCGGYEFTMRRGKELYARFITDKQLSEWLLKEGRVVDAYL